MIEVKQILYATDFSPTSEAALPYACELTRAFGASLHLLHVAQDPYHLPWTGDAYGLDLHELARAWQRDAMTALTRLADKTGLQPVAVCRLGRPAQEILEYTREQAIDLIVIGSHGHGAFAQLLLGSVAERLIRHATCPVLTVKATPVQPSADVGAATAAQVDGGVQSDA
jgi:universal stress protein A